MLLHKIKYGQENEENPTVENIEKIYQETFKIS